MSYKGNKELEENLEALYEQKKIKDLSRKKIKLNNEEDVDMEDDNLKVQKNLLNEQRYEEYEKM